MKSFYIIVLLCALACTAHAQMRDPQPESPSHDPVLVEANNLTRHMSERLRLTESQVVKLRSINHIKLARMDEIQWQYHYDANARKAKLLELEAQYEQECQRILTPSQISLMREEQQQRDSVPADAIPTENGLG
ncbi:hypothetical protein [Solirubrum puertoriconensis]|uniref:DUF4296 domain-containing protein n=1 Tax=Solirubrum puertoriconensis TaxID=1751427 RepID=A0A9X0HKR2_SOLP1|nr:hypothetical protein [Solirubrum puertoriconensis]KUG07730.1 hypothetical protein ASU33_15545 [Solirubrum puertoriconensis]